jgi:hypothetical protein
MVYLDEINKNNYKNGAKNGKNRVEQLDHYIANKKNKIFILIFMEGCGPCNATRPEWKKIEHVLAKDFLNRDDIVIAAIENNLADDLKNLTTKPQSFPTMRYICDGGKTVENYEDSAIENKDRTIDSFVEWVKNKSGENSITTSEPTPYTKGGAHSKRRSKKHYSNKSGKKNRTRKWSLKYKRSINCRRPKGFSQKQHCKYGRKK